MNNMNFTKNVFANTNSTAKIVPPSGGVRVNVNTEMGRVSTESIRNNLSNAYKINDDRFRKPVNIPTPQNTQSNLNNMQMQNNLNRMNNLNGNRNS